MAQHRGTDSSKRAAIGSRLAHHSVGERGRSRSCSAASGGAMKTPAFNTTVLFYPNKNPKLRLFALWYFAILMIVWNILGHTVLGFEQSWASPVVAISTAILMQLLLE